MDSPETVFDGFMNAAAVARHTAQLAEISGDLVGYVVAQSIERHCYDIATSFDPITNYSPFIDAHID